MNLSQFLVSEREKKGYGTPPDSCPTPQWHPRLLGNCLVCIYQFLIPNSNFKTTPNLQNFIFHKLRKTFYLQIYLKITKTCTNRPKTQICKMSRETLDCLKRQRDICVKNVIPSQNTKFHVYPRLKVAHNSFQYFPRHRS